jgi:hypothetical protein
MAAPRPKLSSAFHIDVFVSLSSMCVHSANQIFFPFLFSFMLDTYSFNLMIRILLISGAQNIRQNAAKQIYKKHLGQKSRE